MRKLTSYTSAIPLKNKQADRFMLGMITALTVLLLIVISSVLYFQNLTAGWETKMDQSLTLEIKSGQFGKDLEKKIGDTLDSQNIVEGYTTESAENIMRIVSPWLNLDNIPSEEMSLPTVMHVSLNTNDEIEKDKLILEIKSLSQDIKVNSYNEWFEQSIKQTRFLKTISVVITLALFTLLVMIISLIVRDRILIHREVISLLQTLGAKDNYIRGEFYKHILNLTFYALVIAGVVFILFYGITDLIMGQNVSLLANEGSTFGEMLFTFLFTALFIFALTFIVVRTTVTNALQRLF